MQVLYDSIFLTLNIIGISAIVGAGFGYGFWMIKKLLDK